MNGQEVMAPPLRFRMSLAEGAEGVRLSSTVEGRARTPTTSWKRKRFGEIAARKSTMGNAVALPRVEYEDVIPFSGFFNNDIFAKPSDKIGVQFSEGDVLFGKLRPYLGNWILAEFKGLAVGDWWVLKPKGIESKFLYTLIQSPSFQDVANQSSGSKMPRADWSLVSDAFFYCPNDRVEQHRIGSLFRSLDALIAEREKALEKLEVLKKSMLLKIFPQGDAKVPEVRFKGFEGEWEEKGFCEFAKLRRGLTYTPRDCRTSGVRVLRSSNIEGNRFMLNDDDVFVSEHAVNIPFAKNGDILITAANGSSRLVGKHTLVAGIDENKVVHGGFMLLAETNCPEFLDAAMSAPWYTHFVQENMLGGNGALGNLAKSAFDKCSFLAPPTLIEQQKIGAYFRSLDALIAARREEIEKLKQMKKALLERMFV